MAIVWFIVWFIADRIGDRAPLEFAPVNIWAGALILCIALDLSAAHARNGGGRRR